MLQLIPLIFSFIASYFDQTKISNNLSIKNPKGLLFKKFDEYLSKYNRQYIWHIPGFHIIKQLQLFLTYTKIDRTDSKVLSIVFYKMQFFKLYYLYVDATEFIFVLAMKVDCFMPESVSRESHICKFYRRGGMEWSNFNLTQVNDTGTLIELLFGNLLYTDNVFLSIYMYEKIIPLLYTASETYLYMPHFVNGDIKLSERSFRNFIIVLPLIFFIMAPKFINLSIYFGIFRGGILQAVIFLGVIAIYTGLFLVVVKIKYKNGVDQSSLLLFLSFLLAIFFPIIVMNPKSKLLFVSNVVSTFAHVILFCELYIILKETNLVNTGFIHPSSLEWILPTLVLTNIFAWILYQNSFEDSRRNVMLAVTQNPFYALTFIIDILLDNLDPMTDFLMALEYFRQVIFL